MRPIRVLLVDDYPIFARIAQRFLQLDSRVKVLALGTSDQDLVQMVEQTQANVVLVDLGMSDRSMLNTIADLRAQAPELFIIALTFFDVPGYREAALAAGANDFIVKDALHRDLLPTIHRVVNA